MAPIKPFRYLFVYRALMRWIERQWRASASPSSTRISPTMSRAATAGAAGKITDPRRGVSSGG
jgi:hypothetical protein